MERIIPLQTLSDANKQAYMPGKRVREINPRYPISKELRHPKEFANNIYSSVKTSLKISSDAIVNEDIEADEAEEVENLKEDSKEVATINQDPETEPSITIVSVLKPGTVCSCSFFASLSSMALLVLSSSFLENTTIISIASMIS
ncbi:hypothetical protein GIB67_035632 [Kingdonia uniflora]|uniref:Uncharacterized protein n=1 Tax=Kingdonia uniflora TaxID=39325 RepID=A0A7J7LL03_9MAGN|nr:hypothetical protein GIB67_035632 [Kingdonia uniflora]